MNRPLVWIAVSFVAGILAAGFGLFPIPFISFGIAALGCVFALFAVRVPRIRPAAMALCFIGAGAAWWGLRDSASGTDGVCREVQANTGSNLKVSGAIRSTQLMLPGNNYLRFVVDVDSVYRSQVAVPVQGRVAVQWFQTTTPVYPGQHVIVEGDAFITMGEVNPGVHGYEDHLRNRGIHTLIEASGPTAVTIDRGARWYSPWYQTARLRHAQAQRLTQAMPASILPFIYAVWLGQQSALAPDEYRAYIWSGTVHILSVSGVHAALIFLTLSYGLRVLQVPRRTRSAMIIIGIVLFALMTGASVPAMRAALMVCLYVSADLLDRERDPATALSIAAIVFMVLDPKLIFDIGFQLSYTCIASMLIFIPVLTELFGRVPISIRSVFASTFSVQILPLPIVATQFHVLALAGPIANILVIPILAAVLWLCFAASVLSFIWMPLAKIAGYATLPAVWAIREIAEATSVAQAVAPALTTPTVAAWGLYWSAAAVLAFVTVAHRSQHRRLLVAAFGLFAVSQVVWHLRFHAPEVVFLDVGHGDAAFVRTLSGETILIDGGNVSERYDYGERVVAPFLWAQGVTVVDAIVASHSDRDHMGGLLYVIDNLRIGTVVLNDDMDERPLESSLLRHCASRGVPVVRVKRGDTVTIGSTTIEVLHPPGNISEEVKPNDRSLVLRVPFGPYSFLFTGDIEDNAESMLDPKELRCTVLKVPHHGADTSSTVPFVKAAQPDYAVISTGARGRQVLDEEIVARYESADVPVLRTDQLGAIRFTFNEEKLEIESERLRRGYPIEE